MGILNVTPDSFSDGGRWTDPAVALEHALTMVEDGADMVDVGGESTRPGSHRIDAEAEWQRIGTVIAALVEAGIVVSVDTLHARTARRAADAGAAIVNDVSGGCWDPDMNATVAATDCAYVIQRYDALPGTPQEHFDHGPDVVATVISRLRAQVDAALQAGVDARRIVVDPGLGFSLTNDQCWALVHRIEELDTLGHPVLVGASRKRFLADSPLEDRDAATHAVTEEVSHKGVWAVRVHEVAPSARLVGQGGRRQGHG
ncbi:dihydropteroate synthase [Schaalia sp. 19OD2882]|nr:dihydropteroate synthase [Schaalia sp. 19OD2882]